MKQFKRKICIASVLILSFMLGGCLSDEGNKPDEGFVLYMQDSQGTKLEKVSYTLETSDTMGMINECLVELSSDREETKRTIPEGVEIDLYELKNDKVYIYFNEEYGKLDKVSEIVARSSLVLTLCQIDGVEGVYFFVGKTALRDMDGSFVGLMESKDFVDNIGNAINNYETTSVTLYFANISGGKLKTEIRTGMYDSSKSLERYIVEQIIKGPAEKGNYKTVPESVELISISTSNGICYVDFSRNFIQSISSVKDEIMIYSIVNSLTELSHINKVQFSVEGETNIELHNNVTLNKLYTKDLSYMED